MRAITALASVVVVVATCAHADVLEMERRDDLNSIISQAGSIYTAGTADAASLYSAGLSAASSALKEGTSEAASVFATVTSVGGVVESIVTSVGGHAITLAASGAGVVTSFAGSEYTVIAGATSTANAAAGVRPETFKTPMFVALASVVGGTLLGAWMTL